MSYRWSVNLFFFINGFVFANWASRLPKIQDDYLIDNKAIGFILLAHAIGAFIAMPITGWMISKMGSRPITSISGLLFPIFFLLIPFMPHYYLLFIPFFLMGAATGIMDVAMNAQAVEIEAHLKKPIMTMFHALFSIGMVAGGLAGTYFISIEGSLLLHFSIIGIISFIVLGITSRFLYPDEPEASAVDEVLFAWPRGPIIGLGIIAFCCMMGEGAMADWSTNYLKNIVLSSDESQALGLTAFAAMMTIGRLFGDSGRAKYGDRQMMISGAIFSVIGILLILSSLNAYVVIFGFGTVGLGLSNIVPIVYSLAGTYPGIKPGVGIAMSTTIGYSGFMFGPPIIGFLADVYDLRIALSLIAILFLVMLIIVFRHKPNPVNHN